MASIYDIAKAAGVSAAAVSMALNNRKGVSDQTRLKIIQIAQELGYEKKKRGPIEALQKVLNVVLCISAIQYDYFNNSFYFDIIKHLSKGLVNFSCNLIIRMSTLDRDAEMIQKIAQHQEVDTYIFMGTRLSPRFIRQLVGENVPVIFFNKPHVEGKNVYSVSFDNRRAMYLLTRYAIELGHKEIVYLGYVPGAIPAENRLLGYREAMEDAGFEVKPNYIVEAEYIPEYGSSYIRKMVSLGIPLPSAILCGNDRLAVGVIKALKEFRFKVPGDVSVAGIDNVPLSDMLEVPLTTIDVQTEKIGSSLARLLQDIHIGKVTQRHILVDVSLVKRQSLGAYHPDRSALLNTVIY